MGHSMFLIYTKKPTQTSIKSFLKSWAFGLGLLDVTSACLADNSALVENERQSFNRSALLLIEFQNEWLSKDGKLYTLMQTNAQFEASIKNAEKTLTSARQKKIQIIHSGLAFSSDYKELGNAKSGLRAAIPQYKTFIEGTMGSQFSAPFQPQKTDFTVNGRTGSSAFAGSNLDSFLRNNNIDTLYIMGYALHVCVESTFRAASDLGYNVILIEDATSAFTKEQQHYVLNEVIHHFGNKITTDEFIKL